jgi:hypothetical protein
LNLTYVYNPEDIDSAHYDRRCLIPFHAIQRTHRHNAQLLPIDEFLEHTVSAQTVCSTSDVLILHVSPDSSVLSAIQRWKARDKTVIFDFDEILLQSSKNISVDCQPAVVGDSVFHSNSSRSDISADPCLDYKFALKTANSVISPSKRLSSNLTAFANAIYIPNYLEIERYINVTHSPHKEVILGWGGMDTDSHIFKQSGLFSALKEVCLLRQGVKIMICGSKKVFLDLPVPENQKIFQPWISPNKWPTALAQFDIGLAPLDNSSDDHASWSRVLEYMVMKIPWVASQGYAYNDLRQHGWLVQNCVSTWTRVLLDMIDHLEETRNEAACEPFYFALGQGIDENIDSVLSVYSRITRHFYGNEA